MVNLKPSDIPADFPVRPLRPDDTARDRVTDNTCGLSWDDAVGTTWTPAPSGRCPFEYFHVGEETPGPLNYEGKQIRRVLNNGPDEEIGGVFRLKIAGRTAETKWLSVTAAQVEEIQELLSPPPPDRVWNYHARDDGEWCRWSHCSVITGDTRCPADCRASEPVTDGR